MFSSLKRLFGETKEEPKPVVQVLEPEPTPEPPTDELQFDPEKHLIDPVKLKQYIEENRAVQIIDVREPHEWKYSHLTAAQHIPMNNLPMDLGKLNKEAETVVLCEHGMRSLDCTCYLLQNGFKDVRSLDGGMALWYAKNGMVLVEKFTPTT